jgi:hypothetical protein
MKNVIYFDEATEMTEEQLKELTVMCRPFVLVNDTRTTKEKLADLTNENLLSDMENDLKNFSRYIDPFNVMSKGWIWARWIRSN